MCLKGLLNGPEGVWIITDNYLILNEKKEDEMCQNSYTVK